MNYWRMSMRWGTHGRDFFDECFERGIAALSYEDSGGQPIVGDCRQVTENEFKAAWREKAPHNSSGRSSMWSLAHEVRKGDIIFARSSPYIVARGEVTRGYDFNPDILGDTDCPCEHYVKVDWERLPPFKVSVGHTLLTLFRLVGEDLVKMQSAAEKALRASPSTGGVVRTSDYERVASATEAVLAKSQGFSGSLKTRRAVEQHAMRVAVEHFTSQGYAVEDVSASESYDLRCRRGGKVLCVEVKGTQSAGEEIFLTRNEVAFARRMCRQMALMVVSGIEVGAADKTTGGHARVIKPWNVDKGTLSPYAYSYRLPPSRGT